MPPEAGFLVSLRDSSTSSLKRVNDDLDIVFVDNRILKVFLLDTAIIALPFTMFWDADRFLSGNGYVDLVDNLDDQNDLFSTVLRVGISNPADVNEFDFCFLLDLISRLNVGYIMHSKDRDVEVNLR